MKALQLKEAVKDIEKIEVFLKEQFFREKIDKAVIAISGGIDSALSLTLLRRALGSKKIYPVFLPYQDQSTKDSEVIAKFNEIPEKNWLKINIEKQVAIFAKQLNIDEKVDQVRLGNIMARVRMIIVYDIAKKKQALVCGTENRSEKMLGYYTRVGDEASDIEPIVHLYKTQVRQLAQVLELPEIFLSKAPSAGLWAGQEDEVELGFSYQLADLVMFYSFEKEMKKKEVISKIIKLVDDTQKNDFKSVITEEKLEESVDQVLSRINGVVFKQQVPYKIRI